ncbi:MAG: IS4 family transposase [Nitrosomonas sp.]|nr:IS4 family transposase [Nitrosomonas sp.]
MGRTLAFPSGSIVVVDRGYNDYDWYNQLTEKGIFFVTRLKTNAQYRVINRRPVLKNKGLTSDQTIRLTSIQAAKKCPSQLRRVGYRNIDTGKHYIFLTNNFKLAARTIADIYKARWQVELFFKWIKQNLKIKSFIGTSKDAVMTQIWIAMCVLASGFHQISVKDEQNHAADLAVTTAQFICKTSLDGFIAR